MAPETSSAPRRQRYGVMGGTTPARVTVLEEKADLIVCLKGELEKGNSTGSGTKTFRGIPCILHGGDPHLLAACLCRCEPQHLHQRGERRMIYGDCSGSWRNPLLLLLLGLLLHPCLQGGRMPLEQGGEVGEEP